LESINNNHLDPDEVDFNPHIDYDPEVAVDPFYLEAPVIAFIETTNHCNLRCKHCYAWSGKKRDKELSTERILKLIDEFAEMGVLQVFLTGGEFFSHPDALEILKYARTKPFTTQVFTNGILITEEILAQIPEGTSFFISFDTATPQRTIRGGMDFPKLRERFEWMKKYGHVFRTAISVHRYNMDDVEEIFEWCLKNNYPRPQWLETHPVGRATMHPDILLKPEHLEKMIQIYQRCMDRYMVSSDEDESSETLDVDSAREKTRALQTVKFCQRLEMALGEDKGARSMAYVTSSGDVYPTSNLMSNGMHCGGNIDEQSFQEIWNSGFKDYRNIRFSDFKQCSSCPVFKAGIWCQFRCQALAKNASGDALGCGATDYLKAFMLKSKEYWDLRERQNLSIAI